MLVMKVIDDDDDDNDDDNIKFIQQQSYRKETCCYAFIFHWAIKLSVLSIYLPRLYHSGQQYVHWKI